MKSALIIVFLTIFQIFHPTQSFVLDCEFASIPGIHYICFASIQGPVGDYTVTGITGNHTSGLSNNDVSFIFIADQFHLQNFPQGISNFFPNLTYFILDRSAVSILYGDEIDDFPRLESFSVQNSRLKTINDGLFEKTQNIIFIYFDFNQIEEVGHDLFTPLNISQLVKVNFEGNFCINAIAANPTSIAALIEQLRTQCVLNETISTTLTPPEASTTTIWTEIESTTTPGQCEVENVNNAVCELQNDFKNLTNQVDRNLFEINRLRFITNLMIDALVDHDMRIENLEKQIITRDEKINEMEKEMKWMKEKLLKYFGEN